MPYYGSCTLSCNQSATGWHYTSHQQESTE